MRRKLRNPAIGSNKINNKDSQIFPFDSIDINIIRELLAKADTNIRFLYLLFREEKGL
jgi:hypothetical protein